MSALQPCKCQAQEGIIEFFNLASSLKFFINIDSCGKNRDLHISESILRLSIYKDLMFIV